MLSRKTDVNYNKFDIIKQIIEFIKAMGNDDKVIIFCGKKARADDLSSEISMKGIGVQCIHGSRDQADREQALEDIKEGLVRILIATDVASRGIDIGDITHVINYDFPRNIEEYVHVSEINFFRLIFNQHIIIYGFFFFKRVGRTGRAGKTGVSISFFTRQDWGSADELIKILEEADQNIPDELRAMKSRFDSMKERKAREGASVGGRGGDRR